MNHFQKYLVDEFKEDYQEGHLTRRQALKLIGAVTGSLLVASSILAGCVSAVETQPAAEGTPGALPVTGAGTASPGATSAAPASAGTVGPDDPDVQGADVQFPGQGATLLGYLAQPRQGGPSPVILVCHENRGLTEHIKDVTRRLAKAGYVGLAVDLLSRQGGSAALTSEQVPGALGNMDPEQFAADFRSGWEYLKQQPSAQAERVGMVGFCFGGGVTWMVATAMPELKAAVPFYGPPPPLERIPNIQAPVLAIYGERDQRINSTIPAVEQAMRENNKVYEKIIYPNADHAFYNDTGQRYNAEAARDAWQRTLAWFGQYVKA